MTTIPAPGADLATDEQDYSPTIVDADGLPKVVAAVMSDPRNILTWANLYMLVDAWGEKQREYAGRANLAAVPASEPDMRKLLDEHDRSNPKPHHCYQCGLPLIKNPHPDAGTPDALLAVGAVHECLPCMVKSRHGWYRRAMKAENALRDAAAAPVSGMPDLASLPQYGPSMGPHFHHYRATMVGDAKGGFVKLSDVERLLNPTKEPK